MIDHGTVVVTFVLGGLVGLFTISRLIRRSLDWNRLATMVFLVALVVGALRAPVGTVQSEIGFSTNVIVALFNEIFIEKVTILADGWYVRQPFADRDVFAEVREFCRDMGLSLHLDRLYESHSTESDLIGVTDKQREALHTAYEGAISPFPGRPPWLMSLRHLTFPRPHLPVGSIEQRRTSSSTSSSPTPFKT